jgi:sensor histidine kinase regulating citrate/malate metabolism
VESTKDSHQALVVASVSILIGIVLIGLSRSNITSAYNPFLSAQAFFTIGLLYLGFGLGLLGAIGYIVRLEKKYLKLHLHRSFNHLGLI